MTGPDSEREPKSETSEKKSITKTHEEFIGNEARPSLTKQEYEKRKRNQSAPDVNRDKPSE